MQMQNDIRTARALFHSALLSRVLRANAAGVPSNADSSSIQSVAISRALLARIGESTADIRPNPQTAGSDFETLVQEYLGQVFLNLGPIRNGDFDVLRNIAISQFDQYQHLSEIAALAASSRELRIALGLDYLIKPDVVVIRRPVSDEAAGPLLGVNDGLTASRTSLLQRNGAAPSLHASISCKWTLRSDRAQNARSEALNLIRNRKGRLPHIVVVTAEPTPGRIASLALGTGDIDCIYHIGLDELVSSVDEVGNARSKDVLALMVEGRRLRDISDLPFDLAI